MKFGFFTISTFDLIPLCKHISNHLCETFKESSFEMMQCNVIGAMEYNPRIKFRNLGTLERKDFIRQSRAFRIRKYVKLVLGIFSFQIRNRSSVIYTIDLPTLVIITFINSLFFFNKNRVIYHQFEILEPERMTGYNRFILKLFKMIKGRVDLFIAPEINRLKYFNNITGFPESKSLLFPNSTFPINLDGKQASKPNEIVRIAHVGIAGCEHYVKEFLDVLPTIEADRQFSVTFIGYLPDDVVALIKERNLPNVKLLGDLPHKDLEQLYNELDIGVILYRDLGLNYKYCAPNKLYEYWAHGIYVMAHQLEGLIPLFKGEGLGNLVDMDDQVTFRQGLTNAVNSAGERVRSKIADHFSNHLSIKTSLGKLSGKIQSWVNE